ncbi:MAG: methyltransferase [Clostridia bacterium]|nr:methyltransferase [Clostridia bacterium]
MLKDNEKFEDLEYNGLEIIQHKDGYRFTSDAVLLANSVKVLPGQRVVDLGTGSGIIAIIIAAKTRAKLVYGVEIQSRLADMAQRSAEHNGLTDRIKIVNCPMQQADKLIGSGFDVVVCNPPYEKALDTDTPTEKDICKREQLVSLEQVIASAQTLLKFGGTFYIINKAKRLAEIIYYMKQKGIEPKKITLIQPKADKDIDTAIIEGKKGGKPSLTVPRPLVVYREDGGLTDEARRLYGK